MKKYCVLLIALLLCFICMCLSLFFFTRGLRLDIEFGTLKTSLLEPVAIENLPEDTLYITESRMNYGRGMMTLIIPAINVFTPVGESTRPEDLEDMPGLYEFSQMPGEGNVNVSIAGHRDVHNMVFYHLDKIRTGDHMFLLYEDKVYQYQYTGHRIVKDTDWSVIKPQGFSSLTLTTCDPIGTTLNRMVVTGELTAIEAFGEPYLFVGEAAS